MVALVGLPGSGKSTITRHLGRQLGWRTVDVDHAIEDRIGMPIRVFFERHGEGEFRDVEQDVLARLCAEAAEPTLLATGGGAVLRAANRALLRERSTVVYLRAHPEDLGRRLRHDTQRPLLQGVDPLVRLRELFRVRDPLYRETAHFVVETGRPSVPTLTALVRAQLELAGLVPQAAAEAAQAPGRQ